MIEKILPAEVAVAEARHDPPDAELFPEEEAVIVRAVAKRRREFTTVRFCARRALAELGVPPAPILPGKRGAPQWPAGVVGSMTHCEGYRAAVVARTGDVSALGIDAEPHGPLPEGVLTIVTRPAELSGLAALTASSPEVHWDRLLFSVKESIYKAWFPLTGDWLGFEDADVALSPDGSFSARILLDPAGRPTGFTGRWLVADGLVVSAVTALAP
ncbi:4'-phosphopantetheinyl transferase family protein [Thermomonospora umbrina]|uniref:4'-phosphopantetheinyl transferase EntD n=1 Tax=Thermomonospora umbrina TaxID=111806 RepID=A0A3D9STC7_9ACTN|nr:4'-phosphopantetheinyl transferase superfamily protein [Thermomonospora umbrina]REE95824.1 4'-phosphopantetheinyl transferase EntD [Thermomonospora umbrina]